VTNLAAAPEPPRLIVLPFDNYGPEERANFALGITDEITSQLAMVPHLRVISRTTAVNYGQRSRTHSPGRRGARRRLHPRGQRPLGDPARRQ